MIKLLKHLFDLIFMNPRIIDSRLKVYSEDALKRLAIQNTANQYDTMLNATEAKHTAYFGAIDDKDTLIAIKESRTMSVDNIMVKFTGIMKNYSDIIAGVFGRESTQFHEFFPNKLAEYLDVTKTTIDTLLHRMVGALTTYETDLGTPQGTQMLAAMTSLQDEYIKARGEQELKKAALDASRTDVKAKRLALAMQLQDNLFDIAKEIKGHPERIRDFFSFHLLTPHTHKDNKGNIIYEEKTYALPRNSQKDAGIVFGPDSVFEFYNGGTTPIIVMLAADDTDQAIPENPTLIMPDLLIQYKASELGPENCLHLRMINQSTTTDGQLTVDILN